MYKQSIAYHILLVKPIRKNVVIYRILVYMLPENG